MPFGCNPKRLLTHSDGCELVKIHVDITAAIHADKVIQSFSTSRRPANFATFFDGFGRSTALDGNSTAFTAGFGHLSTADFLGNNLAVLLLLLRLIDLVVGSSNIVISLRLIDLVIGSSRVLLEQLVDREQVLLVLLDVLLQHLMALDEEALQGRIDVAQELHLRRDHPAEVTEVNGPQGWWVDGKPAEADPLSGGLAGIQIALLRYHIMYEQAELVVCERRMMRNEDRGAWFSHVLQNKYL